MRVVCCSPLGEAQIGPEVMMVGTGGEGIADLVIAGLLGWRSGLASALYWILLRLLWKRPIMDVGVYGS